MDLRLAPEGNRENNNICLLYYYHCWLWVYCFLLLTCLTPDPRILDLPTLPNCKMCVSGIFCGTWKKQRRRSENHSFFPSFMKWWSFLKSCKWLAFSRLSLLVNAVALAGNSTMRPINMCPEKFLPSCGTWRTIVTDRKVFAQVRIFSRLLCDSFFRAASFRCSFFTKAENLSSKTRERMHWDGLTEALRSLIIVPLALSFACRGWGCCCCWGHRGCWRSTMRETRSRK